MRVAMFLPGVFLLPTMAACCWAQRAAESAPTLVAHWPLDEGKPGPVRDATGAQAVVRQGQAVGRPGPMNRAFQFASRSDRINTGNSALVPANGDFTLLMWIATRQTDQGYLLSNDGGQPNRAGLLVSGGQLRWSHHGGAGEVSSNFRIADGRWHQVGATRSGQLFTLWIDGRPYPAGKSSALVSQAHGWSIGSNATGTTAVFAGLMDDVRVYRGALDAKAIQVFFNDAKRDVPGVPASKQPPAVAPPARPGDEVPPAFDSRAPVEPLSP